MKPISIFLFASLLAATLSCRNGAAEADAYGNFEADEIIVSAEAGGPILTFHVQEGQRLDEGAAVGLIDTLQLTLRKRQLLALMAAIGAKRPPTASQLRVFERQEEANRLQLATLKREKQRIENLIRSEAATAKQLDDIDAQIEQVEKQLDLIREQRNATAASLNVQDRGLLAEREPLEAQIAQIDDQLARCRIHNPVAGTVLATYVHAGEMAQPGKALYKIAGLDTLILRAYVSGAQLHRLRISQAAQVRIDDGKKGFLNMEGRLQWISPRAEFTPKVIQTKDERVNLVYAIKIAVPNPQGALKIGMPAEVIFDAANETKP